MLLTSTSPPLTNKNITITGVAKAHSHCPDSHTSKLYSHTLVSTGDSPTCAVTFSESVVGFSLSQIRPNTGVPSLLVDHGRNNTLFSCTILHAVDGEMIVHYAADQVRDLAGNANTEAPVLRGIEYDITRPSVTLWTTNPDPTNSSVALFITFSELAPPIQLHMLTATGGALANLELLHRKVWYSARHDGVEALPPP